MTVFLVTSLSWRKIFKEWNSLRENVKSRLLPVKHDFRVEILRVLLKDPLLRFWKYLRQVHIDSLSGKEASKNHDTIAIFLFSVYPNKMWRINSQVLYLSQGWDIPDVYLKRCRVTRDRERETEYVGWGWGMEKEISFFIEMSLTYSKYSISFRYTA